MSCKRKPILHCRTGGILSEDSKNTVAQSDDDRPVCCLLLFLLGFLEVMNVLCCRCSQVISRVVLYVAVDDFLTLFIAWWTLVVAVVATGRGRIMRMFLGPGQKVRGLSMLWNGSGRMTASLYVLDIF